MSANFDPVLECEELELIDLDMVTPEPEASPEILSATWKNSENEDIEYAAVEKPVNIEIKTKGFQNEDKLTVEIKEDSSEEENSVLKTIEVELTNNEVITSGENSITIDKEWINKKLVVIVKTDKVTEDFKGETIQVICCDKSLKKNDEGDFIEELNIRLCGFGGIQPFRKINDDTIKAVKQFQKDYMEVPETGYICKHVLEKLDELKDEYSISFEQLKCTCGSDGVEVLNHITGNKEKGTCKGFGNTDDRKNNITLTRTKASPTIEEETKDGKKVKVRKETTHTIESEYSKYVLSYTFKNENPSSSKINKTWIEADSDRKVKTDKYIEKLKYTTTANSKSCYEYPGMHRSLMWAYKTLQFYLEKEYGQASDKFTVNKISSSYRCRYQDTFQNASTALTFNHMGTAIDIHFDKNGSRTKVTADMDTLRSDICVNYLGAHLGWAAGKIGLELASHGATTWIHMDIREFHSFKADKYFKTTENDINGEKLVDFIKTMDSGKFKSIIE